VTITNKSNIGYWDYMKSIILQLSNLAAYKPLNRSRDGEIDNMGGGLDIPSTLKKESLI